MDSSKVKFGNVIPSGKTGTGKSFIVCEVIKKVLHPERMSEPNGKE